MKEKAFFITIARFVLFATAAFMPFFLLGSSKVPAGQGPAEVVAKIVPQAQAAVSGESTAYKEPSGVPILMYHHVGDFPFNADGTRRDLTVSIKDFTEEVTWLKQNGYTSITLKQLYDSTKGEFTLPTKPIVFTFDDGYADVFENAVPVLVKNNFVGSFAIITSFPGHEDYATWEQILKAREEGMEIVSHTQDHFDGGNSRKYNAEFVFANLSASKKALEEHGMPVNILVYPYGHYTDEYIEQAKKAGFVMALTVAYGRLQSTTDLMRVPRVRVHGQESLEKFEDILMGRLQDRDTSTKRQSPPKSL